MDLVLGSGNLGLGLGPLNASRGLSSARILPHGHASHFEVRFSHVVRVRVRVRIRVMVRVMGTMREGKACR